MSRDPGSTLPGAGEIHVWAFGRDLEASMVDALAALLSPDEVARASRLREAQARSRFIAGRAQLRQVVGKCLSIPPGLLRFDYSSAGKPSLVSVPGPAELHFNATASESLGLVAVRTDAEVGVDVERLRSLPDIEAVARRVLGADEHKEFQAIPKARRETRFFEYWVRKEAAAKALGSGLREGMHRLRIHPWAGDTAVTVEGAADDGRRVAWVIGLPVPLASYVASLASMQPIGPVLTAWWDPRDPD